jgi:hypothetical protein
MAFDSVTTASPIQLNNEDPHQQVFIGILFTTIRLCCLESKRSQFDLSVRQVILLWKMVHIQR